jgi:hypothetical protein
MSLINPGLVLRNLLLKALLILELTFLFFAIGVVSRLDMAKFYYRNRVLIVVTYSLHWLLIILILVTVTLSALNKEKGFLKPIIANNRLAIISEVMMIEQLYP